MKVYFNIQILYLIYKTRVEGLCITHDFLKGKSLLEVTVFCLLFRVSSELTSLLGVIVSLTRVAYIKVIDIRGIYIKDDSISVISIRVATGTFIRSTSIQDDD